MKKLKENSHKSSGFENVLSNTIVWMYHPSFSKHLKKNKYSVQISQNQKRKYKTTVDISVLS